MAITPGQQQRRARAGATQHRRERRRLPGPVRQPDHPQLVGDGNGGGRPVGAGGRERPLRLAADERAGDGAELAVARRRLDAAAVRQRQRDAGPARNFSSSARSSGRPSSNVKVIPMRGQPVAADRHQVNLAARLERLHRDPRRAPRAAGAFRGGRRVEQLRHHHLVADQDGAGAVAVAVPPLLVLEQIEERHRVGAVAQRGAKLRNVGGALPAPASARPSARRRSLPARARCRRPAGARRRPPPARCRASRAAPPSAASPATTSTTPARAPDRLFTDCHRITYSSDRYGARGLPILSMGGGAASTCSAKPTLAPAGVSATDCVIGLASGVHATTCRAPTGTFSRRKLPSALDLRVVAVGDDQDVRAHLRVHVAEHLDDARREQPDRAGLLALLVAAEIERLRRATARTRCEETDRRWGT